MVTRTLSVKGWKSRKIGTVDCYECPICGHSQDDTFWGDDGLAECFGCHAQVPNEQFRRFQRRRMIAECAKCGSEVPLTSRYAGGFGFICSECSNYVAVFYGTQFVQPTQVLDVAWNRTVFERAEQMDSKRFCFLKFSTMKDYLVVQVLQQIVKQEDSRFLSVRAKEHQAGLLLDSRKQKYLGFIVWTEGEHAVLRQIFVGADERRKGHAKRLLKFWVGRYADRLNERFGVESPNRKAIRLLAKLGYLKIEVDKYVGLKCFFVPSL